MARIKGVHWGNPSFFLRILYFGGRQYLWQVPKTGFLVEVEKLLVCKYSKYTLSRYTHKWHVPRYTIHLSNELASFLTWRNKATIAPPARSQLDRVTSHTRTGNKGDKPVIRYHSWSRSVQQASRKSEPLRLAIVLRLFILVRRQHTVRVKTQLAQVDINESLWNVKDNTVSRKSRMIMGPCICQVISWNSNTASYLWILFDPLGPDSTLERGRY